MKIILQLSSKQIPTLSVPLRQPLKPPSHPSIFFSVFSFIIGIYMTYRFSTFSPVLCKYLWTYDSLFIRDSMELFFTNKTISTNMVYLLFSPLEDKARMSWFDLTILCKLSQNSPMKTIWTSRDFLFYQLLNSSSFWSIDLLLTWKMLTILFHYIKKIASFMWSYRIKIFFATYQHIALVAKVIFLFVLPINFYQYSTCWKYFMIS